MGKYRKGDLCKIVRDEAEINPCIHGIDSSWEVGLIVRIRGNYNEVCGKKALFDCDTMYDVEVPKIYNPQCYSEDGYWNFGPLWQMTDCFSWAWVQEEQLELWEGDKENAEIHSELWSGNGIQFGLI